MLFFSFFFKCVPLLWVCAQVQTPSQNILDSPLTSYNGLCIPSKLCSQTTHIQYIQTHSHHTLQVVLSGGHMKRGITMNVDSVEVTSSFQQSLGDVITARQSRPVQADILFLNKAQIKRSALGFQHHRLHKRIKAWFQWRYHQYTQDDPWSHVLCHLHHLNHWDKA